MRHCLEQEFFHFHVFTMQYYIIMVCILFTRLWTCFTHYLSILFCIFCRRSRGYNCCVVKYFYAVSCLHILKMHLRYTILLHSQTWTNWTNIAFLCHRSSFLKIFIFFTFLEFLCFHTFTISTKNCSSWHSFLSNKIRIRWYTKRTGILYCRLYFLKSNVLSKILSV